MSVRGFNGKLFSEMTEEDLKENERMWQHERDMLDQLRSLERSPATRRKRDGKQWLKRLFAWWPFR